MRAAGLVVAAAILVSSIGRATAAEPAGATKPPAKPNIVLIFADDLGWQETGFSGSDYHETPNLDRLAKQGMVFTQAYAAAGNCQPSRACLISGQYTPRHEVYAVGSTKRGPVEMMRLLPIPNHDGLKPADFTLPKAMKSAGYATGMFGKWHLSGPGGSRPEDHFDVVGVSGHSWGKKNADDPKGLFAITDAACRFIEANKDKPFFAYVPHYAIHSPIQSRSETLAYFQKKTPGKLHSDPEVAACLRDLDTGVGMVLDKLKALGLEENTLVLFTSDNGGTHFSQEPLRGKKGCYYEGGIREPMIVRWPAVVKPGTTCNVPVINVDFYATFAAVAGAKLPASRPLDGASLVPLLAGEKKLSREAIFWHFPGYLDGPVPRGRDDVFRTRPVSVIRKGDWKLHLYHEEWKLDVGKPAEDIKAGGGKPALELYNIADDPGEEHDLAATETKHREELLADLLQWFVKTGAKRCTEENPQYRADAGAKPKGKKRDKK
jgi:arylsulfatase A-like enzyme